MILRGGCWIYTLFFFLPFFLLFKYYYFHRRIFVCFFDFWFFWRGVLVCFFNSEAGILNSICCRSLASPPCVWCGVLHWCNSSSPQAFTLAPRGPSRKMNQQPSWADWLKWKWQGTCLGGTRAELRCTACLASMLNIAFANNGLPPFGFLKVLPSPLFPPPKQITVLGAFPPFAVYCSQLEFARLTCSDCGKTHDDFEILALQGFFSQMCWNTRKTY